MEESALHKKKELPVLTQILLRIYCKQTLSIKLCPIACVQGHVKCVACDFCRNYTAVVHKVPPIFVVLHLLSILTINILNSYWLEPADRLAISHSNA